MEMLVSRKNDKISQLEKENLSLKSHVELLEKDQEPLKKGLLNFQFFHRFMSSS